MCVTVNHDQGDGQRKKEGVNSRSYSVDYRLCCVTVEAVVCVTIQWRLLVGCIASEESIVCVTIACVAVKAI